MGKVTDLRPTQQLVPRQSASDPGPGDLHPAAREAVSRMLRQDIAAGIIPAGTRLIQSRLAQRFGVSTGPVRDALRMLADEGFVRFGAGGIAIVHEINGIELEELYEIRKLLEPVAAARAARFASRASILRAGELIAAMDRETDAARWSQYNSCFHRVIEQSGTSQRSAAIMENLRDLCAVHVSNAITAEPGRGRGANAEHEEILRAIITGDAEAAADAMFRHLDGRQRRMPNVHQLGDRPVSR
ncbi:MAG TPA: GntR family transcriptional regulator [Streptosporangiaceae bacterium]|jgi:DNA-binding GntR family transcriptional regulator